MLDLHILQTSDKICFYSDASTAENLGFGCLYGSNWIFGKWEPDFISHFKPSIEYLEIFALCAGLLTWQGRICDCRIVIFCNNTAVVQMINNISSKCQNCMFLLRILVLNGLLYNRRVSATYVNMKKNFLADTLSRQQISRLKKLGPHMNQQPDAINTDIWPLSKLWQK